MGETMVTRLIFVRHAEAEGNINRVFHGWTDSDITEKGHIQAKLVAERLKNFKIDVLYSSSLKRTLKTAEYISKAIGLPVIRTDKLKEINGGDWENVPWSVLPEKWPDAYDSWENKPYIHQMPNGESMKEFQERLVNEIETIINNNKGKKICIVTHGTAIRVLTCYFHHCNLENINDIVWVENTSITIVDYKDGVLNVVVEGDSSHLEQHMKTLENQDWWLEKTAELYKKEE